MAKRRRRESRSTVSITQPRMQISVQLDRVSTAALANLMMDGGTISDVVRTALVEAAIARSEAIMADEDQDVEDESDQPDDDEQIRAWRNAQVALAPPWSEYQLYMLKAAFIDRLDTWLTRQEYYELRGKPDPLEGVPEISAPPNKEPDSPPPPADDDEADDVESKTNDVQREG